MIVAGDFDEDGKQDLVLGTIAGPQQDILLTGNGDGTFKQKAALPGSFGFLSAAVVDLNHDGHLDLIEGRNGPLYIYLGDGHGGFTQQAFTNQGDGGAFLGVTVGDFNNDQKIDFITAAYGFGDSVAKPIRVYSGNGDGTFQAPALLNAHYIMSPFLFASADFNGDGNLDLLFSEPNIAVIYFGNGDGTFKLADSQSSGLPTTSIEGPVFDLAPPLIAAADMNGDGIPDGVVADLISNNVLVAINDGTGYFPQSQVFSAALDKGTGALQVADLNGDGLPDVILTNYLTQKISVFLSIRPPIAPTIKLSGIASQALTGTPLTFGVAVAGLPGKPATGVVTLLDGTATVAQQTLDAAGQAKFTIATFSTGPHSLSVSYTGDASYTSGVSAILMQSITDFQLALPVTTETITAGAMATYSVSLTPVAGLAGVATLSCTGLPAGYTCPSTTVALNGQPTTGSIVITTPATHAQADRPFGRRVYAGFFGFPSLLLMALIVRRRVPALAPLGTLCILALCLGTFDGCSGGGKSSSAPTPSPVTTNFTITAAITQNGQTVSHPVAATLTVN